MQGHDHTVGQCHPLDFKERNCKLQTLTQCLHGEEEMCKRLLNVSLELKMVDTSRTTNALCLDSRDEVRVRECLRHKVHV